MLKLGARSFGRTASIATILAVSFLAPAPAYAHFILTTPGAFETSDASGGPQKNGPCGNEGGGTATGTVTAYQPGATIAVTVTPTVVHPGWWRVALIEGASSTQTPTSLPDPAYTAAGVVVGTTTCLAAVPAVVANPVWSLTQPVILDGVTSQSTAQTLQVTLPQNISCTAQKPCALQVIMIMDDGHITGANGAAGCYYHHCADITIGAVSSVDSGTSSGSGSSSGTSSSSSGTSSSGGAQDASVASSSSGSGSSSGSATSSSSGGASGNGTSSGSGGSTGGNTSGTSTSGSSGGSSGAGAASGAGSGAAGASDMTSGGGGCSISSGGGSGAALGLTGLVALLGLGRRRRTR